MAYTSKINYSIYDLNSSLFVDVIKEVLQVEFLKQRTTYSKTFLPQVVKKDEYLLSPISDKDIDPAFCSVIKAKMEGTEQRFSEQQSDDNMYIIGILANGLENLRKIADAVYIILNDHNVKNYIWSYADSEGNKLISDSGKYFVKSLSTEYEVSKTMNDKEIVYGSLVLGAEIAEIPLIGTYADFEGANITLEAGEDKKEIILETNN